MNKVSLALGEYQKPYMYMGLEEFNFSFISKIKRTQGYQYFIKQRNENASARWNQLPQYQQLKWKEYAKNCCGRADGKFYFLRKSRYLSDNTWRSMSASQQELWSNAAKK